MIIALDGPAGAGKSTIAKRLAEQSGFLYLNSGNFYRAITLEVFDRHFDPSNDDEVIKAAGSVRITLQNGRLYANGTDVEDRLHTDEIDIWVAEHSAIVPVRKIVNEHIRIATKNLNVVAEGRDMTTVVFPDAEIKYYIDASLETRVKRRYNQGVSTLSEKDIRENLEKRDKIDKNKPFGNLKLASDAEYLDTTDLTIEQVCEKVLLKVRRYKNAH